MTATTISLKCHGAFGSAWAVATRRPQLGHEPSTASDVGVQNLLQSSHHGTGQAYGGPQARRMARIAVSSRKGSDAKSSAASTSVLQSTSASAA